MSARSRQRRRGNQPDIGERDATDSGEPDSAEKVALDPPLSEEVRGDSCPMGPGSAWTGSLLSLLIGVAVGTNPGAVLSTVATVHARSSIAQSLSSEVAIDATVAELSAT